MKNSGIAVKLHYGVRQKGAVRKMELNYLIENSMFRLGGLRPLVCFLMLRNFPLPCKIHQRLSQRNIY